MIAFSFVCFVVTVALALFFDSAAPHGAASRRWANHVVMFGLVCSGTLFVLGVAKWMWKYLP